VGQGRRPRHPTGYPLLLLPPVPKDPRPNMLGRSLRQLSRRSRPVACCCLFCSYFLAAKEHVPFPRLSLPSRVCSRARLVNECGNLCVCLRSIERDSHLDTSLSSTYLSHIHIPLSLRPCHPLLFPRASRDHHVASARPVTEHSWCVACIVCVYCVAGGRALLARC